MTDLGLWRRYGGVVAARRATLTGVRVAPKGVFRIGNLAFLFKKNARLWLYNVINV